MQQRQMNQQGQRNPMVPNQMNPMLAAQIRAQNPGAATAVGTSPISSQQQQHGQMGMGQMQPPSMEGPVQFPGGTNVSPTRPTTGMMNPGGLNQQQQQRQLYLMRAAAGGVGATGVAPGASGVNPGMMNSPAQMLAAAQDRQRMEQQQRLAMAQRQGSPLNPAAMGSGDGTHQYPAGLRSNPPSAAVPGIARSTRSPSVTELGTGTPRLTAGRMLPGGQSGQSEEYHRAWMQQAAMRNAQAQAHMQQQQQSFMGAQNPAQSAQGWPSQNQPLQPPQQPAQQFGNMQFGNGGRMQSPSTGTPGSWPHQQATQVYSHAASPVASVHPSEHAGTPRQTSGTPAPMTAAHHGHSPTQPQSNEFDNMMNW